MDLLSLVTLGRPLVKLVTGIPWENQFVRSDPMILPADLAQVTIGKGPQQQQDPILVSTPASAQQQTSAQASDSQASGLQASGFQASDSGEAPQGCPACQLYHKVAVADGLFRDISEACPADAETVPAGYGGTIPQAREALEQAMEALPAIIARGGPVGKSAEEFQRGLQEMLPRLDYVANCQDAQDLAIGITDARRAAHAIAREWWRREIAEKMQSTGGKR